MSSTMLTLREVKPHEWCIFAPRGHPMSGVRRFRNAHDAMVWAKTFVSSWYNMDVELDLGDTPNDQKGTISQ